MRVPDVRLILIFLGIVLCAISGDIFLAFDDIQKSLGKEEIIGPICTAMGYAFVLKYLGCDVAMVQYFTKPLRKIAWLLIPGGAVIGFATNMAITSQTATAAAVGPILVPLMLAAGYRPIIAASTLLLGCSIGGNLFNPGEPDIVAIQSATGMSITGIMEHVFVPNVLSLAVATVVLVIINLRTRKEHEHAVAEDHAEKTYPWYYAVFPPLPVLLLLLLQPGLNIIPPLFVRYPHGLHISTVMICCTALVIIFCSGRVHFIEHVNAAMKEFFMGLGYAFTHVITLIVAAFCFAAGLKSVGIIETVAGMFAGNYYMAMVVSPLLTWALACISGSGTAPSVSFSKAILPSIATSNLQQAVDMGVVGAIGASAGRTMSPVSAIMLFTSHLTNLSPLQIIRVAMWPMLASVTTTIIWGLITR